MGIECFVETKPQKRGHMEGGFLSGFRWVPIGRHFGKWWFRPKLLLIGMGS